jgi:copper chaperone CopZ
MKTVKIIIVALFTIALGSNSYAQMTDHSKMDMSKTSTDSKMNMASTKTETIKVSGNCDMCKARIEKAAKIDGVSKAEWNKETKLLAVTYDPAKTNADAISKKVAAAGHDTEKIKAEAKAYDKLPGCCKYR